MTPSSTIPSWSRFFRTRASLRGARASPSLSRQILAVLAWVVAPKAARSGKDTVADIQGRADLTGHRHVSEGPGALRSVASQLRYSGWAVIRPFARISDCGRPGDPRSAMQTSSLGRAIKHVKAELTSVDGATEINAFGGVEASLEGGGKDAERLAPKLAGAIGIGLMTGHGSRYTGPSRAPTATQGGGRARGRRHYHQWPTGAEDDFENNSRPDCILPGPPPLPWQPGRYSLAG